MSGMMQWILTLVIAALLAKYLANRLFASNPNSNNNNNTVQQLPPQTAEEYINQVVLAKHPDAMILK